MKKTLLASVALAAVLGFAGAANAQIKFGVTGPITGPNAAFGKQLTDGAELMASSSSSAPSIRASPSRPRKSMPRTAFS